jgi:hypothetical protein
MPENRLVPRHRVECPIELVVEDAAGAGMVFNPSAQGCIVQSSVPVPGDGYASASSPLPGQADPFVIDLARVRWVTQTEVELEFRILSRTARRQLQ